MFLGRKTTTKETKNLSIASAIICNIFYYLECFNGFPEQKRYTTFENDRCTNTRIWVDSGWILYRHPVWHIPNSKARRQTPVWVKKFLYWEGGGCEWWGSVKFIDWDGRSWARVSLRGSPSQPHVVVRKRVGVVKWELLSWTEWPEWLGQCGGRLGQG